MEQTKEIRIMMADDHSVVRKGLVQILNNQDGMLVTGDASNGAELISLLEKGASVPHIVILDISMPVMDGYQTAKEIRRRWPDIKILALSMFDSEESIIRMLKNGANGYVLKNVEPIELCRAVRHLVQSPYYYSDIVTGKILNSILCGDAVSESLSERETEFLEHCCSEKTYKEIAEQMNLSPRTIDGYREHLFSKLNITSRVGLAIYAIKTGIVRV